MFIDDGIDHTDDHGGVDIDVHVYRHIGLLRIMPMSQKTSENMTDGQTHMEASRARTRRSEGDTSRSLNKPSTTNSSKIRERFKI